jgi:hypothetical protein
MSRREIIQLPGKHVAAFLIKRGSLKIVTDDQNHFAAMLPGFLFGRF